MWAAFNIPESGGCVISALAARANGRPGTGDGGPGVRITCVPSLMGSTVTGSEGDHRVELCICVPDPPSPVSGRPSPTTAIDNIPHDMVQSSCALHSRLRSSGRRLGSFSCESAERPQSLVVSRVRKALDVGGSTCYNPARSVEITSGAAPNSTPNGAARGSTGRCVPSVSWVSLPRFPGAEEGAFPIVALCPRGVVSLGATIKATTEGV